MFAIAFDLIVAEAEARHPKGVSQAYAEIGTTLARYDFKRVQGSVYTTAEEDLANLTRAMVALKALTWFPLASGMFERFESNSGPILQTS